MEKQKEAIQEIKKLLKVGFIKEIHVTTWLANVVMVPKLSRKRRMCMDFTNLNKGCPKDVYPLSSIDKLVDGASEVKFLSFINAYFGYNQIKTHSMDEEKITFIIENENYYYKVMSFGLKNAGATYQRLMNKVFADQIGRIMEVYMDDIVAKTIRNEDYCKDLQDIFAKIRKFNMRLNPKKCAFGV